MDEQDDELLTVAESAARLKVSPYTIYRWIANGRLPAVRFSRKVIRIRRSDLEEFPRVERIGTNYAAVREAAVAYKDARYPKEETDVDELLQLFRERAHRLRSPDEPARGSPQALLRHVGAAGEELGAELWRAVREAREESRHDAGHELG